MRDFMNALSHSETTFQKVNGSKLGFRFFRRAKTLILSANNTITCGLWFLGFGFWIVQILKTIN